MDGRGIAARIHDLPSVHRRTLVATFVATTALLSWWGVTAVTDDLPIALWWPAAATASVAVLISRGRRLLVVAVIGVAITLVNLSVDRPLELSIGYGLAVAAEAWIVPQMLTRGRAHAQLSTLNQVGWFLLSCAAGALALALVGSTSAAAFAGADPAVVALALFTSHSSALVSLVPLALFSPSISMSRPWWELAAQTLTLAGLTVVVFGPAASLAITFLIITTLMWGAFRLPPIYLAIQTAGLAVVATVATASGVGPFAVLIEADQRGAIFALQLFLLTHAAAGLFVAAQSAEWSATTAELASRERDATRVAHELQQLNTQKDDFISAVSHELRTPVTSILGFSEQLVETQLDAETEQAGRIIHRNARRLADVIEDVLELSRLSTTEGSNRPPTDLDIGRLVQNCVDDTVGLGATAHEVRVDLRLPGRPVIIHAVTQDLVRIMSNLLSNALKFSPLGGTVAVAVTEQEQAIEITIADEGPGIPQAEQQAVWERFYRVQSARHRDVPGTGLGLPIVRALVENRVGGEVSLRSDGEHGTTVVLRIPRAPLVPAQSSSVDETAP